MYTSVNIPRFSISDCSERFCLLLRIRRWISSDQTYTVRYGIGMLMRLYLDEDFRSEYLKSLR